MLLEELLATKKNYKLGSGKLAYRTDLTKLDLMEQDLDLNKKLKSGRTDKNKCDSKVE